MKKIIIFLIFNAVMIVSLQSQSVTNYTCKLDNGITVRMEQCWNHVWVSQAYEALKAGEPSVALSTRTLGELASNSSFKLYSSDKEVKVQGTKPGTYTMKVTSKLTGKPGTLSFDIINVTVKPQSKTTVSVVLYDYQISIDEAAGSQNGQSVFSSKIERYKGNTEQNPTCGVPTLYAPGKHDTPVTPAELKGKNGKIKPGSYDVLLTLGAPGRVQKIWLENFVMKPDVSYAITANLNAGVVEYAGVNRDVKAIHMYPAGTADKQKGAAAPDKTLEVMKCEGVGATAPCPPGTYDVLLNLGSRYEWRKGIVVKTGSRVQVK
ncbi:MAG: hypothetical protein MUF36_05150 [Bacteroidales bacterium]|jgi:hypothetical protein|nr:hypothetical protein [Bacteroidales bacterium]